MTSVPELQQKLFKRMGLDVPEPTQSKDQRNGRRGGQQSSRKEQRKAQRVQKKTNRYSRPTQPEHQRRTQPHAQARSKSGSAQKSRAQTRPTLKPSKRTGQADEMDRQVDMEADDESEDEDDEDLLLHGEDDENDEENDMATDEDLSDDGLDDEDEDGADSLNDTPGLSRLVKEKLAADDAEIDEFERKLGIKKGRKSLPQAFKDDGLDELMGDIEGGSEESEDDGSKKRKSEYDEWLASKRRKTAPQPSTATEDDDENGSSEDGVDDFDMLDDEADEDEDSFDGFDSDAQEIQARPRQKENPYVAPITGVTVAKYVPPSLRKAAGSEAESRLRLQKQVQGLINRLTDANILSIVQSVEELYQKNPRGDVTEVLTDLILAQISKPESLPDQFFVLTGGFAAAVYRIIGSSFGSHLVRRVVADFGAQYEQASKNADAESAISKEASNILTFLSQLYVFETVSCRIIFDYMERLLGDLTEINAELLLRICRMAGRLLRRDDPQALKHVAGVLNKSVAKVGFSNVSARTKFIIETITDLKNSKPKGRGMDSAVVSEHVQRMKKRLGELKSQSRRQDGLAPMGMSLEDIEGADTKGKWWLVGASVPVKPDNAKGSRESKQKQVYESSDEEDMDIVLPDYPKKARAQGFSGVAQISIFTALMSANDYEHGYRQFLNLRLKRDDQLEIARVLVQCVGSEAQYNSYYALVARQACSNPKIKFAFQDRLWKIFRGLGESLFGEEPEDEETADGERMKDERRLSNVAQFYASLVADGVMSLAILKPLDLPEVNQWTSMFVEWLIIALLRECKGKGTSEDVRVERHFGVTRELPVLAAGIHWVLRKKVRKTKLIGAKEAKKLAPVREKAQAAVQAVVADD